MVEKRLKLFFLAHTSPTLAILSLKGWPLPSMYTPMMVANEERFIMVWDESVGALEQENKAEDSRFLELEKTVAQIPPWP